MEETIPSTGPISALVHPSLGHQDLGAILRDAGFDAEPFEDGERIGYRTLTQPRFTVQLQTPFDKRPGEYAALFLYGRIQLTPAIAAEVIRLQRSRTMFAHLDVSRRGRLFVNHTVVIAGGVTTHYLRNQLWHWQKDLEQICHEVRRQMRLAAGSALH